MVIKTKVNLLFLSLLTMLFLVVWSISTKAQDGNTVTITRPQEETKPVFTLLEKIKEGQELLRNSPPLQFVEQEKTTKVAAGKKKFRLVKRSEIIRQESALAILDTKSGNVFEKRYWLEKDEIEKANDLRRYYLENSDNVPHFNSKDPNETFKVVTSWWNNFNSDQGIINVADSEQEKDRYIIAANKFLLKNENFAYAEDVTGQKYSDLIYTPYSTALHQPELIAEGKNFVGENVSKAFSQLKTLEVESAAFPEKLVADSISETFVKNIFITEQSDPRMLLLSDDEGRKVAERVLVLLGANGNRAFRYTFSKTGALGLGQIMPGTYSSIVKRYPDAQLLKDIDIGRVDVKNAIMASVLVFDDHLATVLGRLSKNQRNLFNSKSAKDPDFVNQVRAAAYNGGPSKYKASTATISLAVRETVDFVKKYKMIRDLKLFQ